MVPISRREFVKTTAKGVVIASIPFFFKANPLMALTTPGSDGSLQSYMDHFGVSETMIREIMSAAMGKGGDYCDLFFPTNMEDQLPAHHRTQEYLDMRSNLFPDRTFCDSWTLTVSCHSFCLPPYSYIVHIYGRTQLGRNEIFFPTL